MMEALRLRGFAALPEEEEMGRRRNVEVGRKRVASCRLETQEAMKLSLQRSSSYDREWGALKFF